MEQLGPLRPSSSRLHLWCKFQCAVLGISTSVTLKLSRQRRCCPCASSELSRECREIWGTQALRSCLHRRQFNAPESWRTGERARCPPLVRQSYRRRRPFKAQGTLGRAEAPACCPALAGRLFLRLHPFSAWETLVEGLPVARCLAAACRLSRLLHPFKAGGTLAGVDAWARCPPLVRQLCRHPHLFKPRGAPPEADVWVRGPALVRQ